MFHLLGNSSLFSFACQKLFELTGGITERLWSGPSLSLPVLKVIIAINLKIQRNLLLSKIKIITRETNVKMAYRILGNCSFEKG